MSGLLAAFTEIKLDTFISTHKQLKRNIDERTKKEGGDAIDILILQMWKLRLRKVSSWQ